MKQSIGSVSALIALSAATASADIEGSHFSNIEMDLTIHFTALGIDMDGDGTNDFDLNYANSGVTIIGTNGNEVFVIDAVSNETRRFDFGTEIGQAGPVATTSFWINLIGEGVSYAGVKFQVGAQTNFGWIQFNIPGFTNGCLVRGAWENTSETSIQAGGVFGNITPAHGPLAGGNIVVISNCAPAIGSGFDITNVLFGGVNTTNILDQGTNWIRVVAPAHATSLVDILIQSDGLGDSLLPGAYTYDVAGPIDGVSPASGDFTGGYAVTIRGTNMGIGSDITNVTLCGVSVASIVTQSATEVVVTAGAGVPGLGDVRVFSESYGESVASNAFAYLKHSQTITFFAIPAQHLTSEVPLSATASSGLPVSFEVAAGPGFITGEVLGFTQAGLVYVVASQPGSADYAAAVPVTNSVIVTGCAPGDYSGDGTTALTMYDPATGKWYCLARDGRVIMWNLDWGGPGMIPVEGDFDGDGIADLAVYDAASGAWYIRNMAGVIIDWGLTWGGPGLEPVTGDFNGDGATDLAVYDELHGLWYIRTLDGAVLAWAREWGCPNENMQPVAGDYDGDRVGDLCVYDQPNGLWYALSGAAAEAAAFNAGTPGVIFWGMNWGGAGYEPVTGDYDGDQVFDLAVYSEAVGRWFVRSIAGVVQAHDLAWGGPGMAAVPGDYDGDGAWDVMVVTRADGYWYAWSIACGEMLAWGTQWGGGALEPVMR